MNESKRYGDRSVMNPDKIRGRGSVKEMDARGASCRIL
jgi:hypothetical protein